MKQLRALKWDLFFSLDIAVLPNARIFILKLYGQLEDQKDDIFLASLIALKYFLSCTKAFTQIF